MTRTVYLICNPPDPSLPIRKMNWLENIQAWKKLPEEEKLRIRWEAMPQDVAESMSFEGEPVSKEFLSEILSRIEPPAMLKPRTESFST